MLSWWHSYRPSRRNDDALHRRLWRRSLTARKLSKRHSLRMMTGFHNIASHRRLWRRSLTTRMLSWQLLQLPQGSSRFTLLSSWRPSSLVCKKPSSHAVDRKYRGRFGDASLLKKIVKTDGETEVRAEPQTCRECVVWSEVEVSGDGLLRGVDEASGIGVMSMQHAFLKSCGAALGECRNFFIF